MEFTSIGVLRYRDDQNHEGGAPGKRYAEILGTMREDISIKELKVGYSKAALMIHKSLSLPLRSRPIRLFVSFVQAEFSNPVRQSESQTSIQSREEEKKEKKKKKEKEVGSSNFSSLFHLVQRRRQLTTKFQQGRMRRRSWLQGLLRLCVAVLLAPP